MTQDEIFDAARQSHLDVYALGRDKSQFIYRLEAFAKLVEDAAFKRWAAQTKLVVDEEREAIKDEFWLCVQSDLENGVKSLNEKAFKNFVQTMPELSKFGGWLETRG